MTWSSSALDLRVLPVYAGSEGLSVLALDCRGFGGQAGASAHIENYLGFPTGITGLALMARAYNQAQKFGVEMAIPNEVKSLQGQTVADGRRFLLTLANKERVRGRTVVIAGGARYRRLDLENLADFEGSCVHYWASPLEGRLCTGQEVALVGGGNSAGQAAVYLSSQVAKVWLIVRGPGLEANMSRYLVERIAATPNVEILTETTVTALEGQDGILEAIRCCSLRSGEERSFAIRHLFYSSARIRIPTGCLGRVLCSMTGASCAPAQTSTGRSKPTCLGYSRSVMSARVRSSALPLPSERAHR